MITCKVLGGLCNQMFAIATTYAHALDNNFQWGLDFDQYDLPLQGHKPITYKSNLYATIPKINVKENPLNSYYEPRWEYDPIPPVDNVILNGYFQSPKYFNHHREKILELFLNIETMYGTLNPLKDRFGVELQDSIGIHIRRGDYLKFPNHHPLPSLTYYIDAMHYIVQKENIGRILVFSDDIKWCEKNFNSPKFLFVKGLYDYQDLLLYSLCNHQVMSNSSFSWWGAYLNTNPNKIVYAPKLWFGKAVKHGWDDIYLPEMKLR